MSKKPTVNTFSKEMTLEEAEAEKRRNSEIGKSLKRADELYNKRRKK